MKIEPIIRTDKIDKVGAKILDLLGDTDLSVDECLVCLSLTLQTLEDTYDKKIEQVKKAKLN